MAHNIRKGTGGRPLVAAALSTIIFALPGTALADETSKTPVPPTVVFMPAPPAPPAPPMMIAPSPPREFKPAPVAGPPMDPKVRKSMKKQIRADKALCIAGAGASIRSNELGLDACDRLLAMALDDDDPWDYRAYLLQHRALFLIALGGNDTALAELDEADGIGKGRDILFDGGLGIGNGMLRAIALSRKGEKDAALVEVERIRAIRPHVTVIDRPLDRIRNSIKPDTKALLDSWSAKVKWQPDAMRLLVPLYIWQGDLPSAAKFIDDVSLIDPKPQGGWTVSGEGSENDKFIESNELDLQRAYVLAGTGQPEKAKAIIAEVRGEVPGFVGLEPVPSQKGGKVSKSKMAQYQARKLAGEKVAAKADSWEKAIALRADAAVRPAEELADAVAEAKIGGTPAGIDIMRQLHFSGPEEGAAVAKVISQFDEAISNGLLKIENRDLGAMLPDPEYLSQVPKFGWGGSELLFGAGHGYSQAKEKGSDVRTVRFGTYSGTGPMAEELGLLSVAQYAEKEGKDSFILLARRAIERQTSICYYGCGPAFPAGYESQLRVVLLDSKNLPPEWADDTDRLIFVKEIKDQIKPKYDQFEARKAAEKAKKR